MFGAPKETQRIDKWIWHARITKTRTLAQKLVSGGKVRVNREKVAGPSQKLTEGDVLTIKLDRQIRILEVAGFSQRRGPYAEACKLYKDLSPQVAGFPDDAGATSKPVLRSGGKPDRRERRMAIDLKQNSR